MQMILAYEWQTSWWVVMYSYVIFVLSVYVILIILCLFRHQLWLTETDISYVTYLTAMNNKPNRTKLNFGTAPIDDRSYKHCYLFWMPLLLYCTCWFDTIQDFLFYTILIVSKGSDMWSLSDLINVAYTVFGGGLCVKGTGHFFMSSVLAVIDLLGK